MYHLIIIPKAKIQLSRLPQKDQTRIAFAVQQLREDPWMGKTLRGDFKGMFAIRVWPYRIVYAIDHAIITIAVVFIGHRKDVYKKLKR